MAILAFSIQKNMMAVMSHVATPSTIREGNPNILPDDLCSFCEEAMDTLMEQMEDNSSFILPGGTPVSAQLQFARTVARRAERRLWTLHKQDPLPEIILRFINRLSDLFLLWPVMRCNNRTGRKKSGSPLHIKERRKSDEKNLHPIMLAGTGSDVGKSVIAAALCRIFKQDGYRPAPFKAQNMALNSYATPEGLEIGRAQAVQAEAAGVPCHTDMNPLLLKPSSDHTSQVVLNGRPIGNRNAFEYFRKEGREELRQEVNAAFDRLAARYNPIVMEGAGSISEINLRDTDLVNMPMACYADADVILVADIDRGGVFASVYGSVMLQTPEDKKRIKGVIINKFRGDIRLFESGVKMMEDLCGIPVLGIIPYYRNIHIEEEDSVGLDYKRMQAVEGKINIAVVLLRHLSNFTDFNRLERDERVHLYYTNNTEDLAKADIILLPGSKSTLDDLYELRRNGVAQAVLRAHREGVTVMGICGGYQLMGLEIHDPEGVEGEIRQLPGLGLLPVITTMQGEKVTRQVNFHFLENAETCQGYEIHMGETRPVPGVSVVPLNRLEDGGEDGCFVNQKCMGSYIHGILDNQAFIDYLLEPYAEKLECHTVLDYRTYKEEQYDKLAEHVRSHLNLPLLYQIMSGND